MLARKKTNIQHSTSQVSVHTTSLFSVSNKKTYLKLCSQKHPKNQHQQHQQQKPQKPALREQALVYGVSQMTVAQLLMLIVGSGTTKNPVGVLATQLQQVLAINPQISVKDLQQIPGISVAKACQIVACIELSKRTLIAQKKQILDNSQKVYDYMRLFFLHSVVEEFHVLCVNTKLRLISHKVIATGTVDQVKIELQEILKFALQSHACAVILVHNHPSNDPNPSAADLSVTDSCRSALSLVGISLIDHVIVCRESFFSFAQNTKIVP
jgi:DNA repair protein RadC